MSNVDDLLEPLRYKSLGDYALEDIRSIGGGVFTEAQTLEHLSLLDRIAKAYQSVHIPTLGNIPISGSSEEKTVTLSSTASSVNLASAADNEVLEIVALSVSTNSNYGTSGASLAIETPDNDTPTIIDLSFFDVATAGTGVFYGNIVKVDTNAYITPPQLLLNGGETLILNTRTTPNDDVVINVLVRKYSQ
tara:strand:+ start:1980 stop:2552 length:573 start_codon:yes stop_codon:yes gene_type:complete